MATEPRDRQKRCCCGSRSFRGGARRPRLRPNGTARNGGYRIIKQRVKLFHGADRFIAMDFVEPPIEFAALARSVGVQGHPTHPTARPTGHPFERPPSSPP